MKNIRATGEAVAENRQELSQKYFGGWGGVESVYARGNLGIVSLLSDLQEQINCGFNTGSAEHYRQILNDIKSILIEDSKSVVYYPPNNDKPFIYQGKGYNRNELIALGLDKEAEQAIADALKKGE